MSCCAGENIWQISVVHRHIKQLQNIAEFIQHEMLGTGSRHHQLIFSRRGVAGQSRQICTATAYRNARSDGVWRYDNDAEMLRLAGIGRRDGEMPALGQRCMRIASLVGIIRQRLLIFGNLIPFST